MRIEREIIAVLEGAGLALVGVHRHQPRPGLGANQRPLAAGRKARAAEAAQPGVADDLDQLVAGALAGEGFGEDAIAARRHVMLEVGAGLKARAHAWSEKRSSSPTPSVAFITCT